MTLHKSSDTSVGFEKKKFQVTAETISFVSVFLFGNKAEKIHQNHF